MSQEGAVFFMGDTTLEWLFQRRIDFLMHVLSGAYESLTISLTEYGIFIKQKN